MPYENITDEHILEALNDLSINQLVNELASVKKIQESWAPKYLELIRIALENKIGLAPH